MLKVALVSIVKDNPYYIHEWIEYNLKLGFDHIVLYMNDFNYTIDHPQVEQFGINGRGQQLNAYNHFIKIIRNLIMQHFLMMTNFWY